MSDDKARSAAAKVMKDPKASKDAKTAAASALTQSKSKEATSPKAASAAAKVMKDKNASKDAKSAAASALTQKAKSRSSTWPSIALVVEAEKALGLAHSSSCKRSKFMRERVPCDCGVFNEARRIVLAVGPLIAEQTKAVLGQH